MLITARYWLDRLRHPRSRADDLAALRQRFAAAQRDRRRASAEEVRLAIQMRGLREQLAEAVGAVSACANCTRGYPWPEGAWDGGHCCSAGTDDIFREAEVAALVLAGTRARHLRSPRAELAGCAFRGPRGCTLSATHRPNACVRYLCSDLRRELFARGDIEGVEALVIALEEAFGRFATMRAARLERQDQVALEQLALRSIARQASAAGALSRRRTLLRRRGSPPRSG